MTAIVVKGRPFSVRASSRSRQMWQDRIRQEATKGFQAPLTDNDLVVTITFFYKAFPDFDTDNISKPIVDALNGIAFLDDKQVSRRYIQRRNIRGQFTVSNPDPLVAKAIADGDEFVCITIERDDPGVVTI